MNTFVLLKRPAHMMVPPASPAIGVDWSRCDGATVRKQVAFSVDRRGDRFAP